METQEQTTTMSESKSVFQPLPEAMVVERISEPSQKEDERHPALYKQPRKIVLIDPKTRKEIEVNMLPPSGYVRNRLAEIEAEGTRFALTFFKDNPAIKEVYEQPEGEREKMLQRNPEMSEKLIEFQVQQEHVETDTRIEFIRIIVDTFGQPNEVIELLKSDADGEFWQFQDQNVLEDARKIFRTRDKRG